MLDSLVRVSRRAVRGTILATVNSVQRQTVSPEYIATEALVCVFENSTVHTVPTSEAIHAKASIQRAKPATGYCVTNTSLSEISRTVSLSFQSAFQLSLTVLVCYRSLVNI